MSLFFFTFISVYFSLLAALVIDDTKRIYSEFTSTTTSTFAQELTSWTKSGSSSPFYYTCSSEILMAGYKIGGTFSKTYSSLPSHDLVVISFRIFGIDSWSSTDQVKLTFGTKNYFFTGLNKAQFTKSTGDCGSKSNKDFGEAKGKIMLFHNTTSLSVSITPTLSSKAFYGVREIKLAYGFKTTADYEFSCFISTKGYSVANACNCTDPTKYYNPVTRTCVKCNTSCNSMCTDGTNSRCVECKSGYFYNGYNCQACPSGCLACNSSTSCITCSSGLYKLSDGSCGACNSPMTKSGNFCISACSSTQFLYWDGTCLSYCNNPLLNSNVGKDKLCTFPCSGTNFLYSDKSCASTCVLPYSSSIFKSKNFCNDPCRGPGVYEYDNFTCGSTCPSPNIIFNMGSYNHCGIPCTSGYYKYENGSCLSTCNAPFSPQTISGYQFCNFACPSLSYLLTSQLYNCSATCPLPFQSFQDGIYRYCTTACPGQFQLDTGTCSTTCPSPFITTTTPYLACESLCSLATDYLYPDLTCNSICDSPMVATSIPYQQCQSPCAADQYYNNETDTCLVSCDPPLEYENFEYYTLCYGVTIDPIDNSTNSTTSDVVDNTTNTTNVTDPNTPVYLNTSNNSNISNISSSTNISNNSNTSNITADNTTNNTNVTDTLPTEYLNSSNFSNVSNSSNISNITNDSITLNISNSSNNSNISSISNISNFSNLTNASNSSNASNISNSTNYSVSSNVSNSSNFTNSNDILNSTNASNSTNSTNTTENTTVEVSNITLTNSTGNHTSSSNHSETIGIGYEITDKKLVTYVEPTTTVKVTQSIQSAATTAASVSSSVGAASGTGASAFGMITLNRFLYYTRFLKINFPKNMQNYFAMANNTAYLNLGLSIPSGDLQFPNNPIEPSVFDNWGLSSSFISNYWMTFSTIVYACGLGLFISGLHKIALKLKKKQLAFFFDQVRILFQWNFALIQFCTGYDSITLYASIDFRTNTFSSDMEYISFFFALITFISMFFFLYLTFKLAKENQKAKKMVIPETSVKLGNPYTRFWNKWKGFQILFAGYKDDTIFAQALVFFFMIRNVIWIFTIAFLFEYPFAQCIIMTSLSLFMLILMISKRPFVNLVSKFEIPALETVTLLVQCCILGICVIDQTGVGTEETKEALGSIVVTCFTVFGIIAFISMGGYFILGLYSAIKIYRDMKAAGAVSFVLLLTIPFVSYGMDFKEVKEDEENRDDRSSLTSLNKTSTMISASYQLKRKNKIHIENNSTLAYIKQGSDNTNYTKPESPKNRKYSEIDITNDMSHVNQKVQRLNLSQIHPSDINHNMSHHNISQHISNHPSPEKTERDQEEENFNPMVLKLEDLESLNPSIDTPSKIINLSLHSDRSVASMGSERPGSVLKKMLSERRRRSLMRTGTPSSSNNNSPRNSDPGSDENIFGAQETEHRPPLSRFAQLVKEMKKIEIEDDN